MDTLQNFMKNDCCYKMIATLLFLQSC